MRVFFTRYRSVLTSRDFVISALTAFFVLVGALTGLITSASLVSTVLLLIAVAIGGIPIIMGAIRGLIRRELNVDELIAIAIIVSVILKEYLSAGFVAFMMLFGKVLEDFTAKRAVTALENLGKLTPLKTCVLRDGKESEIPLEEVIVGDIVVTRPGERIAVDGIVISGQASVNQAPITGESVPVVKTVGSEVYAGTLNELGALEIKTTEVGKDTALSRIADLVLEAEEKRAPIVRTADRYAKYFTPLILVLSGLVYLFTRNLTSALAVLIVACPCALVMATPIAIIAGVANGARRGILIKGGARLEAAGRVTAVALDKTGTITLGEPRVMKITPLNGLSDKEVLKSAAIAEGLSEHPVAKAILIKAKEIGLDVPRAEEFHVVPGYGVIARIDGSLISVGTEALLDQQGIYLPVNIKSAVGAMEDDGLTPLLVASTGTISGIIGVADSVRPDVKAAIENLRHSGLKRVVMLTGDSPEVAKNVSEAVGINEWQARLLPARKVEAVKQLQAEGHRVAMIGDGINDAPALAQAEVGIAMGISGTDVAMETSDIVLMQDDILMAAEAINLSRKTLRTIKQNLAFALVFNLIGIVAAGAGILNPVAAALFHNFGSVAVVINSARLVGTGKKA
jgi:Cd2+/Zn2+-exporting ATPase